MSHPGQRAAVAGLVVAAVLAAGPAAASAVTMTYEGTPGHAFSFTGLPDALTIVTANDGSEDLSLVFGVAGRIDLSSPVYADVRQAGGTADPRSVQALAGGRLLFADRAASMVVEVSADGAALWTYTKADDPDLQRPFSAQRITVGGRELTLITDRWAARVFAVDAAKQLVWQYGTTGQPGLGVNHLADPFAATYSSAGTVLIADNNGGNRVIEVRWSDYAADAPDSGFTAASVVWSYGTPGEPGNGPDHLQKPRSPQRLPGGDVLIGDADGDRVFVVDRRTKETVWQFGATDDPGPGLDRLQDPTFAARLPDGDTLIADTGNHRILRVPAGGGTPDAYDLDVLGRPSSATASDTSEPRGVAVAADGSLVEADSSFGQVVSLAYPTTAPATSAPLDCGLPGEKKAFVRVTWKGDTWATGTKVAVDYQLDGGTWRPCRGISATRAFDFPAGTVGTTIAYRVTLSTSDRSHCPVLDSIALQSRPPQAGDDDGGGGGDRPGGSGNSGGSGEYTFPGAAGGTGASGAGTGSGASGTGSGAATGGGVDTGAGGSGVVSDTGVTTETFEPPVFSSGSGPAVPVRGIEAGATEGVTGVPLRAAEGSQLAEPRPAGPGVPVLALCAAALLVGAAFFVPWPFVAAEIRSIAGFDHTRPKRFRRFRQLVK